jgi:thiol-disulfide isomerase/thioredoxin
MQNSFMKSTLLIPLAALSTLLFCRPLSAAEVAASSAAAGAGDLKMSESELREQGAFGFPQKQAEVFCDTADLRLSVCNSEKDIYVQAVLWKDNDSALGKTEDGRTIGDYSELLFNVGSTGVLTPNVDRDYLLNPWPEMCGLYYQVVLGKGSTSGIKSDTQGRGAIRYIQTPDGRKIRVDVYLIPLKELSKLVSDTIRLVYYGSSAVPDLTVNSGGYDRGGKRYYGSHIPNTSYHSYVFKAGSGLIADAVPDGRHDPSLAAPRHPQPMPRVGMSAPEIAAKDWLNTELPPSLSSLRGKLVLVDFWATWCGPCIASIPHLNELQNKYASQGFTILGFTEQNRAGIEAFLKRTPMVYAIGLEGNDTFDRYGVSGIPRAFLVNETGKIIWEGSSEDKALDAAIASALKGDG